MIRYSIFILVSITILAGAEVATIVTSISPLEATRSQLWTFFISLWLTQTGIFTLLWHLFKQRLVYPRRTVSLLVSVRQASLMAALLTLALFFSALKILTFWDFLPLTLSALLIEFFFQADTSITSRNYGLEHRG